MLETVTNKINLLIHLFENIDILVFEVNNRDKSEELIIYLNTEDQLFKNSEDALGNYLGDYSDFTATLKQSQNQPFKSITLKDSGDLYKSFETEAKASGDILINADTVKGDRDLVDRFGQITGLNDENEEVYREYFKNALLQLIRKEILAIRNIN